MSRANITSMNPKDCSVTFALRSGESRQYWYEKSDFLAILGGDDPANYSGSQEPMQQGSGGGMFPSFGEAGTAEEIGAGAETIADIGEIGLAGLL